MSWNSVIVEWAPSDAGRPTSRSVSDAEKRP